MPRPAMPTKGETEAREASDARDREFIRGLRERVYQDQ